VFEQFWQGESPAHRHDGLGLGLAIARQLVELHGGVVCAENRPTGTGALFRVRLPRRITPPANGDVPAARSERPERRPTLAGVRVLVLEDDRDGREVVGQILERAGAVVVGAATSAEALALVGQTSPHAIVADIELPGEDGYAFVRRLRALPAERGGRTPAAALTAAAGATDRLMALEAGFHIHIPKPVQPDELIRLVAYLAGRC
jgi:CheY-like chemotaxis protein